VTRWLTAKEQDSWLALAMLMMRLPAALEAQLQRDSGLSHFEYQVMAGLSEQEGRVLQMSEIARISGSSLSRLSHVVSRMERRGWVARARVAGPGRRTTVTLTDAGFEVLVAAAPGHVAAVRAYVVDALGERELAALGRTATRIQAAVEPEPTPPTA
jgi:DNA-binding MarR family transcriptional regulator